MNSLTFVVFTLLVISMVFVSTSAEAQPDLDFAETKRFSSGRRHHGGGRRHGGGHGGGFGGSRHGGFGGSRHGGFGKKGGFRG